tara:strand:- start:1124 stop:1696 length:573 start_codon:yes stop_codon:yes gene_type:complete
MKKIAILASGGGSNAESILKHFSLNKTISVSMVISNKRNAGVFDRAEKYNVPCLWLNDDALKKKILSNYLFKVKPDLIVLAGFLLKISSELIREFPRKIINIHPSLLPSYGGKGMFGDNVHKIVKKNGETQTGITIHYVNEEYDKGEIIFQKKVNISKNDSVNDISKKVQALEHLYYSRIIEKLLSIEKG